MTFNLHDSYGMLMHQIRWRRNRSRREKKCWLRKDVRGGKDGSKVQSCLWWWGETVCLRVLCHLCLEIKERRKKITYRALVSFLWQPEDYYHTLPFIMKGLALTGSKTGRGEGRTVRCIFSAHSWETEGKGMNEFKKNSTLQSNAGMSIEALFWQ